MVYYIKGHRIHVYDNTQNLPILRFQKFNKYMMMANEVGNTFQDYDARTAKALQFLHSGMYSEAMQELNNRRQSVFNAYNEFTPKGKAFAVLIFRINDTYYPGYSATELDDVLKHLDSIGLGYVDSLEILQSVKKKSKPNYKHIFQSISRKIRTLKKQSLE